jgi:RimJ/RimL family protein N-acetyltransferase
VLTLRTPRLVLDAPRESDIAAVLAACQDEQTQRWVPLPDPYTLDSAEFFVRSYCPHGLASGQYTVWALRPADTEPLVGVVEVRRDEQPGSASLGCWLEPASRGQGVMHEALVAVAAHALDPDGLGFAQLRWEYLPGNDESRRLAEGVGFDFRDAEEHRVLFHGEERAALVGVLLRGDRPADG